MARFGFRFKGTLADLDGLPLPENLEVKQVEEEVRLTLRSDNRDEALFIMHGLAAVICNRLGIPMLKEVK